MADITNVHIHYVDFEKKHYVRKIQPSEQGNTLRLKQDIAKVLTTIKHMAEYYYVTLEAEGKDGKPMYRTIVKKTFLNA